MMKPDTMMMEGGGAPAASHNAGNGMRDMLVGRYSALSDEQRAVLDQGVSPEATAIIMQIMPELGDAIEMLFGPATEGPDDARPSGEMAPEAEEEDEAAPMPPRPRRPKTALGDM